MKGFWIPVQVVEKTDTLTEAAVLSILLSNQIWNKPPLSNLEISRRINNTPRTVREIITKLEKKKLLKRKWKNGERHFTIKVPEDTFIVFENGKKPRPETSTVLETSTVPETSPPTEKFPPSRKFKDPINRADSNCSTNKLNSKNGEGQGSYISYKKKREMKKITQGPLTRSFVGILERKRKIKISPEKMMEFDVQIKAMVKEDGIKPNRIKFLLNWWELRMGQKYMPRINSGKDLRDKWLKLEDAYRRSAEKKGGPDKFVGRKPWLKLIETPEQLGLASFPREKAAKIIGDGLSEIWGSDLREAGASVEAYYRELRAWAVYHWTEFFKQKDLEKYFAAEWVKKDLTATPNTFAEYFGTWLVYQRGWLQNVDPKMLGSGQGLLGRFISQYCKDKGIKKAWPH